MVGARQRINQYEKCIMIVLSTLQREKVIDAGRPACAAVDWGAVNGLVFGDSDRPARSPSQCD